MTTLISAHNSEGCYGRCDAKCHEATHEKCDCICGGVNHGVGLRQAVLNTREMLRRLDDELEINIDVVAQMELPGLEGCQ